MDTVTTIEDSYLSFAVTIEYSNILFVFPSDMYGSPGNHLGVIVAWLKIVLLL